MTFRGFALVLALLFATVLAGCATTKANPDPWEPMNRGTFAFNEFADAWVVSPAARAWRFVLPNVVETGIDNFFENAGSPVAVLNNVLQGEVEEGYLQTWRFVLNSTFGIAGFIDVASLAGWPDHPEDFGLTLGTWGVAQGPYLVLPVFGASSVRDTVGMGVDGTASAYSYFVPFYVPIAAKAVDLLNQRAIFFDEIAQSREEAFDFYVFVRNAYLQNRERRLRGGPEGGRRDVPIRASEEDDDLYYFDEDPEDEETADDAD